MNIEIKEITFGRYEPEEEAFTNTRYLDIDFESDRAGLKLARQILKKLPQSSRTRLYHDPRQKNIYVLRLVGKFTINKFIETCKTVSKHNKTKNLQQKLYEAITSSKDYAKFIEKPNKKMAYPIPKGLIKTKRKSLSYETTTNSKKSIEELNKKRSSKTSKGSIKTKQQTSTSKKEVFDKYLYFVEKKSFRGKKIGIYRYKGEDYLAFRKKEGHKRELGVFAIIMAKLYKFVDPAIPEHKVFLLHNKYEAKNIVFCSKYLPNAISLDDYLRILSEEEIEEFHTKFAVKLGRIFAHSHVLGENDLNLGNILVLLDEKEKAYDVIRIDFANSLHSKTTRFTTTVADNEKLHRHATSAIDSHPLEVKDGDINCCFTHPMPHTTPNNWLVWWHPQRFTTKEPYYTYQKLLDEIWPDNKKLFSTKSFKEGIFLGLLECHIMLSDRRLLKKTISSYTNHEKLSGELLATFSRKGGSILNALLVLPEFIEYFDNNFPKIKKHLLKTFRISKKNHRNPVISSINRLEKVTRKASIEKAIDKKLLWFYCKGENTKYNERAKNFFSQLKRSKEIMRRRDGFIDLLQGDELFKLGRSAHLVLSELESLQNLKNIFDKKQINNKEIKNTLEHLLEKKKGIVEFIDESLRAVNQKIISKFDKTSSKLTIRRSKKLDSIIKDLKKLLPYKKKKIETFSINYQKICQKIREFQSYRNKINFTKELLTDYECWLELMPQIELPRPKVDEQLSKLSNNYYYVIKNLIPYLFLDNTNETTELKEIKKHIKNIFKSMENPKYNNPLLDILQTSTLYELYGKHNQKDLKEPHSTLKILKQLPSSENITILPAISKITKSTRFSNLPTLLNPNENQTQQPPCSPNKAIEEKFNENSLMNKESNNTYKTGNKLSS